MVIGMNPSCVCGSLPVNSTSLDPCSMRSYSAILASSTQMQLYNSEPTTVTACTQRTCTHSVFDLELERQKTCLELGIGWNQLLLGCVGKNDR